MALVLLPSFHFRCNVAVRGASASFAVRRIRISLRLTDNSIQKCAREEFSHLWWNHLPGVPDVGALDNYSVRFVLLLHPRQRYKEVMRKTIINLLIQVHSIKNIFAMWPIHNKMIFTLEHFEWFVDMRTIIIFGRLLQPWKSF